MVRTMRFVALALSVILATTACARLPDKLAGKVGGEGRQILVDRGSSLLYYVEQGSVVRVFPVVEGKLVSPTPTGRLRIGAMTIPKPDTAYGTRKMSLERLTKKGTWERGAYALHGTNQEALLAKTPPRRFSNGCIRMRNADAEWLYDRVRSGDPVVVVP